MGTIRLYITLFTAKIESCHIPEWQKWQSSSLKLQKIIEKSGNLFSCMKPRRGISNITDSPRSFSSFFYHRSFYSSELIIILVYNITTSKWFSSHLTDLLKTWFVLTQSFNVHFLYLCLLLFTPYPFLCWCQTINENVRPRAIFDIISYDLQNVFADNVLMFVSGNPTDPILKWEP